jgi:hypothetical protein
MGSGSDDWVYCHFFTITVIYNSSHIELLHDVTSLQLQSVITAHTLNSCMTSVWLISHRSLTDLNFWIFLISRMSSLLYLPRGPNVSLHVEQLIPSIVIGLSLFSGLLPSNDSFVAIRCSENGLPSRFSVMDLRSGSTFPAFSLRVTIF